MTKQKFEALAAAREAHRKPDAQQDPDMEVDDPGVESAPEVQPAPAQPAPAQPAPAKPAAKSWPTDKSKPDWNDLLKLELLMAYTLNAPDPFSRSETANGKAAHKGNVQAMVENGVTVEVPGHGVFLLSSLAKADHFICCLQGIRKAGFSVQRGDTPGTGGLVHALDRWFEESGAERSKEVLVARSLEIRVWLKEKFVQE